MALIYLLDTNIVSEMEQIEANPNVVARFTAHYDQVALASISWHEILYGYHRLPDSRRKERVGYFIRNTVQSRIPILPYTGEAADWFAVERARLSRIGLVPARSDGQIAAVAAVNNLILVTRNRADFAHFAGLRLENWFESAA
jgi:tRNA(fMet)-specific endonuclease VapC